MKSILNTTTASSWMTGFTAGATTTSPVPDSSGDFRDGFQYGRAHQLGDNHAALTVRPFDGPDGDIDMRLLLQALGETGPVTPETADHRVTLVNAYGIAYDIRSRKE
jgi:hypothetical protein